MHHSAPLPRKIHTPNPNGTPYLNPTTPTGKFNPQNPHYQTPPLLLWSYHTPTQVPHLTYTPSSAPLPLDATASLSNVFVAIIVSMT